MTRIEYLLNCLIEECAEVQQRTTKALRFGLNEKQVDQSLTNKDRIQYELNDLVTIIYLLEEEGISIAPTISTEKMYKVEKYFEYSKQLGIVN